MAIKDILLQLTSYPDRTPVKSIMAAVEIADLLDAKLTAAVCKIDIPDLSNYFSRHLTDIAAAIAAERHKSGTVVGAMIEEFTAALKDSGRAADTIVLKSYASLESAGLIGEARLHDLTIMPMATDIATQFVSQDLVFGSGRPVLLLPHDIDRPMKFDTIVVAWDSSRVATRALADAVPFLKCAKSVRLVTVTGDKPFDDATSLGIVRNLQLHGVTATIDSEPMIGFEGAGAALLRYCKRNDAGLLVMGAYGHSRVRDFIVGGATKAMLADVPLPILLAH